MADGERRTHRTPSPMAPLDLPETAMARYRHAALTGYRPEIDEADRMAGICGWRFPLAAFGRCSVTFRVMLTDGPLLTEAVSWLDLGYHPFDLAVTQCRLCLRVWVALRRQYDHVCRPHPLAVLYDEVPARS